MREDKLGDLSMELSVDVLQLTKELRAKLEISLKETNETSKWLEMLYKSEYIDEQRYKTLDRKCSTIRVLLVKSITTAKNNLNTTKRCSK